MKLGQVLVVGGVIGAFVLFARSRTAKADEKPSKLPKVPPEVYACADEVAVRNHGEGSTAGVVWDSNDGTYDIYNVRFFDAKGNDTKDQRVLRWDGNECWLLSKGGAWLPPTTWEQ